MKQTASRNPADMNAQLLEYALSQISPLVSTALELAGMDASCDGYADMIYLETIVDSSQCLKMETDPSAKNLTTCALRPYLVNVKDSNVRDQLLESVGKIKSTLAVSNLNGMAQDAVLKNIPDYIQLCPDLEAKCLWFDCTVNVKVTRDGSSKIHQLGLNKLCLKTLESPVGQFKIATLTSKSDMNRPYLNSLVTSDMLVQDYRTPSCALVKISFASKPGIEYSIELVSDKPKESVSCRSSATHTVQKIPLHPILSEVILRFLCKDTPAHESVFCTPGPAHVEPRVIASSSSNTTEPAAKSAAVPFSEPVAEPAAVYTSGTVVETVVETPGETFVEPAVQTASETTMETPADTHCASPVKIEHTVTSKNVGARVGGLVASKVRFFNGLAEHSTTPAVSASTEVKAPKDVPAVAASAEVIPADAVAADAVAAVASPAPARTRVRARARPPAPAGAPGPARTLARARIVELPSIRTTTQEAEEWVSYFSQPHNVANDEGGLILPPIGSPVELLSCWIFIPRMAKTIITSAGGPYDERLFFAAVAFLEMDKKRKLNLAGDAF
ncbi:hypothetical protein HDU80_006948 [Chytriomyces hyalinus]|nr:hypothetical protein HDU80_006948 [Chytriomyces hyalinus]